MSRGRSEFVELIAHVRAGSQDAARQLIARYGDVVYRTARRRLPKNLRRLFDSDDFAQIVWNSIFRHRARLVRFDAPADFEAFLATVAANKVRSQVRRYLQQQTNNLNRERPLDSAAAEEAVDNTTPSRVAVARECWLRLLDGRSPLHQEIIRLRSQGYTSGEIAARVGMSAGSVRRVLRKVLKSAMS